MDISEVLRRKGTHVITIKPDDTVQHLVELLDEHNIGALVVSVDGASVDGIVSERDVVRQLRTLGADVLNHPVSDIMTREVYTCQQGDPIEGLAHTMTSRRVRHVPVVKDGRLTAIVSIGDVVKYRIDQLMEERNQLLGYLHG